MLYFLTNTSFIANLQRTTSYVVDNLPPLKYFYTLILDFASRKKKFRNWVFFFFIWSNWLGQFVVNWAWILAFESSKSPNRKTRESLKNHNGPARIGLNMSSKCYCISFEVQESDFTFVRNQSIWHGEWSSTIKQIIIICVLIRSNHLLRILN